LQKKKFDELEKTTRLRGAVIKVISAVKMERILQRKTINAMKATPSIDALTRQARANGFFEADPKDLKVSRLNKRRGGVDASQFAPAKLVQMCNSPPQEARQIINQKTGTAVRRRSIILDVSRLSLEAMIVDDNDDSSDDDEDKKDDARLLKFHCPFAIPDFCSLIDSTTHWRDYRESR